MRSGSGELRGVRAVGDRLYRRRRLVLGIAAALLVPVLCGGGILMYLSERNAKSVGAVVGEPSQPNRIELYVTAQGVDAAQQRLLLRVEIIPHGTLAAAGLDAPAKYLSLFTSSATKAQIDFPAGHPASAQDLDVSMYDGTVSDYPFDGYDAQVAFAATMDGQSVPIEMTFGEIDPVFHIAVVDSKYENSAADLTVHVSRSQGTQLFAGFLMVVMWALALSVLAGAWILVTRRRGLDWTALGWMAATLFALAGMRNTAPGTPPIGCILDYAAFFWAELLTAVAVVMACALGAVIERRREPGEW
ncbi:DUF4436 family protein [Actinospica sp. MGRD01-02]|uniref:DUF4436 family protein n=1 Tax=Actinospica acidithermotolerans TaxID=2828514 RepID=A0A941ILD0_9ACTN|nr:DUF4436 family protein [Actinospica acidithermotolerans]MBR7827516.1 DUF4436 family protein [Actinospica acidithermotolerans]